MQRGRVREGAEQQWRRAAERLEPVLRDEGQGEAWHRCHLAHGVGGGARGQHAARREKCSAVVRFRVGAEPNEVMGQWGQWGQREFNRERAGT